MNRTVINGHESFVNTSCTVLVFYITIEVPVLITDDVGTKRLLTGIVSNDWSANVSHRNQPTYTIVTKVVKGYITAGEACVLEKQIVEGVAGLGGTEIGRLPFCHITRVAKNVSTFASYPTCPMVELSQNEYILYDHETEWRLTLLPTNVNVDNSSFWITDQVVFVCSSVLTSLPNPRAVVLPNWVKTVEPILTYVCLSVSCFCLLLCLVTYCRFPQLQNLPGKNTMNIVCCLLASQLTFLFASDLREYPLVCKLFGILMHEEYLCSGMWTSIATMHMFRVFRKSGNPDVFRLGTFVKYVICGYGIPTVVVGISVAMDEFQWGPFQANYGGKSCFISSPYALTFVFAIPIGLILMTNMILFALIIHSIQKVSPVERASGQARSNLVIYARMSCLMGFNWILGFAANFLDLDILWLMFILANGLQGLFTFLAIVCTPRVIRMWRMVEV